MKINSINSAFSTLSANSREPQKQTSFNANLRVDEKVIERMSKDLKFRDIINRFEGWLSAQTPIDAIVNIITKRGKVVEQMDYTNPNIPVITHAVEDLEISMNGKKSGFYYNTLNSSRDILKDLEFVFECLK